MRDEAGFDAMTIDAIAAERKIPRATLYAAMRGARIPTVPVLAALVRAWNGDPGHWLRFRSETEAEIENLRLSRKGPPGADAVRSVDFRRHGIARGEGEMEWIKKLVAEVMEDASVSGSSSNSADSDQSPHASEGLLSREERRQLLEELHWKVDRLIVDGVDETEQRAAMGVAQQLQDRPGATILYVKNEEQLRALLRTIGPLLESINLEIKVKKGGMTRREVMALLDGMSPDAVSERLISGGFGDDAAAVWQYLRFRAGRPGYRDLALATDLSFYKVRDVLHANRPGRGAMEKVARELFDRIAGVDDRRRTQLTDGQSPADN
ncbi:hypothetical protein ACWCPM_05640 [Streptomyces sp. NPDC002309]